MLYEYDDDDDDIFSAGALGYAYSYRDYIIRTTDSYYKAKPISTAVLTLSNEIIGAT